MFDLYEIILLLPDKCYEMTHFLFQVWTLTSYHEPRHNHRWAVWRKVDFLHRSRLILRGHPHSIASEVHIGCCPLGTEADGCHLSEPQVGWSRNGCQEGHWLKDYLIGNGEKENKMNFKKENGLWGSRPSRDSAHTGNKEGMQERDVHSTPAILRVIANTGVNVRPPIDFGL